MILGLLVLVLCDLLDLSDSSPAPLFNLLGGGNSNNNDGGGCRPGYEYIVETCPSENEDITLCISQTVVDEHSGRLQFQNTEVKQCKEYSFTIYRTVSHMIS